MLFSPVLCHIEHPNRLEISRFCCNRISGHYGVGLINVLAYKLANLPEWAQRLWVQHNTAPEGGLSEELHMAQNLADPADTVAPEVGLLHNLYGLQGRIQTAFGVELFRTLPKPRDFFKKVHRFYNESFADVCLLAKEIHRTV